MAVFYVVLSAMITALTNLLIRRGLDVTRGAKGDPFIVHRFVTAALCMLPIIIYRHGSVAIDSHMLMVGLIGGLSLGLLQYTLGRSLHYGPPALSFIFVSAACVIPPIIMFFIFGEEFGHGYSLYNLLGSVLVLIGLYWMAKTQGAGTTQDFKKWFLWAAAGFTGGILHQLVLQWRALMLKDTLPASPLLPFHCGAEKGDCYMIAAFLTAAICQVLFNRSQEKSRREPKQVVICGLLGGIMNCVSLFFLLLGTEAATTDIEKAILFPINTVLLIFLCNIWASMLYKEKVNWPANAVSMAGIAVGSRS